LISPDKLSDISERSSINSQKKYTKQRNSSKK